MFSLDPELEGKRTDHSTIEQGSFLPTLHLLHDFLHGFFLVHGRYLMDTDCTRINTLFIFCLNDSVSLENGFDTIFFHSGDGVSHSSGFLEREIFHHLVRSIETGSEWRFF